MVIAVVTSIVMLMFVGRYRRVNYTSQGALAVDSVSACVNGSRDGGRAMEASVPIRGAVWRYGKLQRCHVGIELRPWPHRVILWSGGLDI